VAGFDSGHCLSIVSLTASVIYRYFQKNAKFAGVSLVDPVNDLSALFERYRIRASWLLVSAIVWFLWPGIKIWLAQWLTIISVPVVSALAALAMMGWFNQLFSLFNLFALLLYWHRIDDAIFSLLPDKRASTSLAVTLSAFTTLWRLVTAISSTEIVHALVLLSQ